MDFQGTFDILHELPGESVGPLRNRASSRARGERISAISFEDATIVERIEQHPIALWKMRDTGGIDLGEPG